MPLAAKAGRIAAATSAPTIAHNSHAGKLAPAILMIGSHPASAHIIIRPGSDSVTRLRIESIPIVPKHLVGFNSASGRRRSAVARGASMEITRNENQGGAGLTIGWRQRAAHRYLARAAAAALGVIAIACAGCTYMREQPEIDPDQFAPA